MTKKFWNDWKERFDMTYQVFYKKPNSNYNYSKLINNYCVDNNGKDFPEKIISHKFKDNNTVDLVIERHKIVLDPHYKWHYDIINETVSLHRKDITSVKFIQPI